MCVRWQVFFVSFLSSLRAHGSFSSAGGCSCWELRHPLFRDRAGNIAKAETPILWSPDVTSWLIWKDSDAGKDWGQEEKGTTQDEMVGWRHKLNTHEFEQAPGDGEGQGRLVCCSPWCRKELDTNEWLNSNKCLFMCVCIYLNICVNRIKVIKHIQPITSKSYNLYWQRKYAQFLFYVILQWITVFSPCFVYLSRKVIA